MQSQAVNTTGHGTVVVYHKDCPDGFGAAWAAHKRLPDAEYIPMAYHEPLPDLLHAGRMFILDFSFDRDEMARLSDLLGPENVELLDHHATAEEELSGLPNCHVDLTCSGAMLAWRRFFPEQAAPALIEYVQDRDLWKWELPDSRAVSAYIGSWFDDRTFARWDVLDSEISSDYDRVVSEGYAILRASRQLVEQACDSAHIVSIDGHDVPAVNSAVLQSEIGERLRELYPGAPFAAIYTRQKKLTRWSLRSAGGGHDVSRTARRLGGGGHPAAAGFISDAKSQLATSRVEPGMSPAPPVTRR